MMKIYLEQETLKKMLTPKAYWNYLHSPYTIFRYVPVFKNEVALYGISGFCDGSKLHYMTMEEVNTWFTNLRKV